MGSDPRTLMAKQLLDDLKAQPMKARFYPQGASKRLRDFIAEHVPEAEVVKRGRGHVIRIKEKTK